MNRPGTQAVTRARNSSEKVLYGVGNRGGHGGPPVQGFHSSRVSASSAMTDFAEFLRVKSERGYEQETIEP